MLNCKTLFVSFFMITLLSFCNMYADGNEQYTEEGSTELNNTLSTSDENIKDAFSDVKKYLDDNAEEIILEKLGNLTPKDHEDLRKIFLELPEDVQVRFIAYIQVSCMATTTIKNQDLCLELIAELNDLHTKSMNAKKKTKPNSKN